MNYTIVSAPLRRTRRGEVAGWFIPQYPSSHQEAHEYRNQSDIPSCADYRDFSGKVAAFLLQGWQVFGAPVIDLNRRRVCLALVDEAMYHRVNVAVPKDSFEERLVVGFLPDPKSSWARQVDFLRSEGELRSPMRSLEGRVLAAIKHGWIPAPYGPSLSGGQYLQQALLRSTKL